MQHQSTRRETSDTATKVRTGPIPCVVEVGAGATDEMIVTITGSQSLIRQIHVEEDDGVLEIGLLGISRPEAPRRGGGAINNVTGSVYGNVVQADVIRSGVSFDDMADMVADWAAVRIVVEMPRAAGSAT